MPPRRKRKIEPYVPPPGSPSLHDVVRGIIEGRRRIDQLDDAIGQALARTEHVFRERYTAGRPVDVPFPPWGKLAWSGRQGRWRLVVIDEDECEELSSMPALCRTDACHVLHKLAKRMDLL
jgi:NAD-dependent dihydropyrimidine dehydrogenase PreA subunit